MSTTYCKMDEIFNKFFENHNNEKKLKVKTRQEKKICKNILPFFGLSFYFFQGVLQDTNSNPYDIQLTHIWKSFLLLYHLRKTMASSKFIKM